MSGLKIGDIDVGNKIIDHEFSIRYILKILDRIIEDNPKLKLPPPAELQKIRSQLIEDIKKDYPGTEFK